MKYKNLNQSLEIFCLQRKHRLASINDNIYKYEHSYRSGTVEFEVIRQQGVTFELSGHSNYIIHCNSNYVQNFELEINLI